MPAETSNAKAELRAVCLETRERMSDDIVSSSSAAIRERLFATPEWKGADLVHTYVDSKPNEVETRELIRLSLEHGKRMVVPIVAASRQPPLHHAEIRSLEELAPGPWGLLQPADDEAAMQDVSGVDLVLVPGIAFDRRGGRLGLGRGFYDGFLAGIEAPRIGLTYEELLVEEVPEEEHDERMDIIITEANTYHCHS